MREIPRWVLFLLGIFLLIYLLWYFSNIVVYILVAGVLSVFGRPVVNFLKRRKIGKFKMPSGLAALLTVVLMWLAALGVASLIIPFLVKEIRALGEINIDDLILSFQGPIKRIENLLREADLLREGQSLYEILRSRITQLIDFTQITTVMNRAANITGNIFVTLGSITFILFFFLKEENLFYNIIIALIPEKNEARMSLALQNSKKMLSRYLRGVALQITLLFIITLFGLMIIGMRNAFLIAALAGIFNIIPYIGPLLGACVGLLFGITASLPMEIYPDMFFLSLKILAVFGAAQLIDNYINTPLIFSKSVKAHPLEIFIVIIAGGTISGIIGMFVAVPVYTVIKLIAKEFFGNVKVIQDLTGEM